MKILEYLEKAWIVASIVAAVVTLYNLVTLRTFDHRTYFPFFCGLFCLLIWQNIRGQRRLKEVVGKEKEKDTTKR